MNFRAIKILLLLKLLKCFNKEFLKNGFIKIENRRNIGYSF